MNFIKDKKRDGVQSSAPPLICPQSWILNHCKNDLGMCFAEWVSSTCENHIEKIICNSFEWCNLIELQYICSIHLKDDVEMD